MLKLIAILTLTVSLYSCKSEKDSQAAPLASADIYAIKTDGCKCQMKASKYGAILHEWRTDSGVVGVRGCKFHCEKSADGSDSRVTSNKRAVYSKVSAQLEASGAQESQCVDLQLRSAKIKRKGKERKSSIAYKDFNFCIEGEREPSSTGSTGTSTGSTGTPTTPAEKKFVCPTGFSLLRKVQESGKEIGLCRMYRTQDLNELGFTDRFLEYEFAYGRFKVSERTIYLTIDRNDYVRTLVNFFDIKKYYSPYNRSEAVSRYKGPFIYSFKSTSYSAELIVKTDLKE